MGHKVIIGALALVFLATACGPIKNKKKEEPDELTVAGFNSGFNGAIYFDNKESYQRLDMRSGQSENFLASSPRMTSLTSGADRFVSIKRSKTYPELLIMNRNKDVSIRIALPENPEGTPKLSPNGQFVIVGGIAGDTKIYNMGGQIVANLRTNINSYEWMPDGTFLFSRFGTIYKMETDFKTHKVYRQMSGGVSSLALSPDSTSLAFEMKLGSSSHIYVYDMSRDTLRQITTSNSSEHFPAWAPNGGHLVLAKGKLVEPNLIDASKTKPQGCLQLWIVNAHAEKISNLNSEDLANTFLVKQNVEGQSTETCATAAPAWRSQ